MLVRGQFQYIVRDDINVVVQVEKPIDGAHYHAREAQTGLIESTIVQIIREQLETYYDDGVDILCP